MINKLIITSVLLSLIIFSCNNGPKVISANNEKDTKENNESTGIFSDEKTNSSTNSNASNGSETGMHEVIIKEILPTNKYIYLYVEEGDELFWIATGKQEVNVGQTIFYKGGLLKTNFESKEHNRIFDKVYLVSRLVTSNRNNETVPSVKMTKKTTDIQNSSRKIIKKGSIKISEIVENPEKFEGKTVQLSGECVKVNYNIMGKNWIHIKDGTKDEYDLVITTSAQIPEGHIVTMKGLVTLNKDFGAGYRYDIILEDGTIVDNGN